MNARMVAAGSVTSPTASRAQSWSSGGLPSGPSTAVSRALTGLRDRVAAAGYTYREQELPDAHGRHRDPLLYRPGQQGGIVVDPRLRDMDASNLGPPRIGTAIYFYWGSRAVIMNSVTN